MNEKDARRLAKSWAEFLLSPKELIQASAPQDVRITLANVIQVGAMLLGGVNTDTRDPLLKEQNQGFLGTVLKLAQDDPEGLEDYLFNLIMEKGDGAVGDINEAIAQFESMTSSLRAKRNILKRVMEDSFPKPQPGRPTDFDPIATPGQLVQLSSKLLGVSDAFLKLRRQFPKRPLGEVLQFLHAEDPDGVDFLRKHEAYLPELITELAGMHLKKHQTKVQRLADALAGKELFDWSCAYSLQRVAESRRSQKRAK